ncbi:BTB/POZ domain-containing protein 6-like isoform X2 [Mizuhopecten yessoensis]|nr:BTB/POZ domain-containing protein 6-like isoform X2 [Mizuhopecten yessoensis]
MFEGNLAEKGEIAIPDIEQEVFTMFLRYLYTDTIELAVDTATSVLSAARKYMVDRLVKKCETFLKSSLTTENVCLLLEQAHIYTEESLKEDCINEIARSPEEVLKSTSFVELCGVCVKSITEPDDLAVEESVVYEAVMRWSEAKCGRQGLEVTDTNRRQVLGDIIYTVRFPIIDAKYLLQHVMTRDVLTSEQLVSVMRFQQDNKAYPCTEFSVNQRNVRKPVITMLREYPNNYPWPAEIPDDTEYYRTALDTGDYPIQPNATESHQVIPCTNQNYPIAPGFKCQPRHMQHMQSQQVGTMSSPIRGEYPCQYKTRTKYKK